MKRFLSIILSVLIFAGVFSCINGTILINAKAAVDFTCGDNMTWELDTESCELHISGSGIMNDYLVDAPWSGFRAFIKKVIIDEGVISIGKYAFYNCYNMNEISIPSSLISIETSAFSNTSALTKVSFADDPKLTFVKSNSFTNCKYVTSQTGAVYFGPILLSYNGTLPANTVLTVKDGTNSICSNCFKDMTNLKDIIIPDSVRYIGSDVFEGTTWLDNQPDGLVYAGKVLYTYKGTMQLSENPIIIADGTTGIAARALENQKIITELVMPDSITTIGEYALAHTNNLSDVTFSKGMKYIDVCGFDTANFKNLYLPKTIEYIGSAAFRQNSKLESVVFEEGYSYPYFPEYMFDSDYNLKIFMVPDSVKRIESDAFFQSFGLDYIIIPDSVTYIGPNNFMGYDSELGATNTGTVICCYEDSYAYDWAIKNGFGYLLPDEETDLNGVNDAIAKADKINRSIYTAESLSVLDLALKAVDLNSSPTQEQADAWEKAINDAIAGLKLRKADYSAVSEAISTAGKINRNDYSASGLSALDSAIFSVVFGLDITEQSRVNAFAESINSAIGNLVLVDADYSKISEAVGKAGRVDRLLYTKTSLEALDQCVGCVEYGLSISEQTKVDGFADKINEAIAGLRYAAVSLRDDINGVIVNATAFEIYPTSVLTVEMIDPSYYELSDFAVGGRVTNADYYDISLVRNGAIVQPAGTVTVRIRIPDGVDPAKCKVYHVTDDPVSPLVRITSALDGKYISFETDHFSEFAVVEVETVVDSVNISSSPVKTEYAPGETIDLTGLEITAGLSDGTTVNVDDYDISQVDMTVPGTKTVTVYYSLGGITKSVSFTITVIDNTVTAEITYDGKSETEIKKKVSFFRSYSKTSLNLECEVKNSENYTLKWTSDNSKVTVDTNGKVTTKGFFGIKTANITLSVIDKSGKVIASDSVKITFFKLLLGRFGL